MPSHESRRLSSRPEGNESPSSKDGDSLRPSSPAKDNESTRSNHGDSLRSLRRPRDNVSRVSKHPDSLRPHHQSQKSTAFLCRVCNRKHALKACPTFLRANTEKRMRWVLLHKYCANCLAHQHSKGSCLNRTGCRICQENHHTLLHMHERLRRPTSTLRPAQPSPLNASDLLAQHTTTLFPTVLVVVRIEDRHHYVRSLLDPCVVMSLVSSELVEEFRIPTTRMGDEEVCSLTIRAHSDNNIRIQHIFKVSKRIVAKSPSKPLDATAKDQFPNMILADPQFFENTPISLVLGNDVHQRVLRPGVFPSASGLPVAQNTMFGWVLSGAYSV